jgi:hypothetical protein
MADLLPEPKYVVYSYLAKSCAKDNNSERVDNADYKIFSDGSGHDDGIGASAVLYIIRKQKVSSAQVT